MCIYFGDRDDLTYSKREHVFPASIGGANCLPKGYVSDQANEMFSKHELIFSRNSYISMLRMLYGPGKRGSLSPKKATKSKISIHEDDEKKYSFGYVSGGLIYTIPSLFYDGDNQIIVSRSNTENRIDVGFVIDSFIHNIKSIDEKYVFFEETDFKNKMLIGWDNKNWYVAAKTKPTAPELTEIIEKAVNGVTSKNKEVGRSKGSKAVKFNFVHSKDTQIVCTKIAINALAAIKCKDYVLREEFCNSRNIATGNGIEDNSFLSMKVLQTYFQNVDNKSHSCTFLNIEKDFVATISLYGNITFQILLSKSFDKYFNIPRPYICDWKNRKDYCDNEYYKLLEGEENV